MSTNHGIAVITEQEFNLVTQDASAYDMGKQSVNEYIIF